MSKGESFWPLAIFWAVSVGYIIYIFKPMDTSWDNNYNILLCLFASGVLLLIALLFGLISNVTQSALRIKFPAEQSLEEE